MGRIKEWEELTICDNFLFQKVMQNQRLCKRLIEKLLDIKVKSITYPATEKSIAVSATQKSVRLDLYVETDTGVVLDIEIQTTDGTEGWLPKRTRYYQSMIDLDVLEKGKEYNELKPSYVIFICTFDPFKAGRKIYTFTNRCHEEDGLELGDEATKIFLNAKGTTGNVNKDIDSFLAYVDGKSAEGKFTKDIATEVDRVKQHKETKVEYMTLMMELKQQRREGREEGKAEGKVEGKLETIINNIRSLMKKKGWSLNEALEALDVSPEDRITISAKL